MRDQTRTLVELCLASLPRRADQLAPALVMVAGLMLGARVLPAPETAFMLAFGAALALHLWFSWREWPSQDTRTLMSLAAFGIVLGLLALLVVHGDPVLAARLMQLSPACGLITGLGGLIRRETHIPGAIEIEEVPEDPGDRISLLVLAHSCVWLIVFEALIQFGGGSLAWLCLIVVLGLVVLPFTWRMIALWAQVALARSR